MRLKGLLLLLFVTLGVTHLASASHMVGADFTYECLGNNRYRINLVIYQDCLRGQANAIAEDVPAYIGIFDLSGNIANSGIDSIGQNDLTGRVEAVLVPPNFKNSCINNPPPICLRKVTFSKVYTLAPSAEGYRIVYVRCCRNASILNINSPNSTGGTYFCTIPPFDEAPCNSSAVFKNFPPQIICINNPLVYDHSATDTDGDSLSYEFCDTYPGGALRDAKPLPSPFLPSPISFAPGYTAGFSATRPMGGNPVVQINPVTGMITGTPNVQGRFIVTVCCHEWRNGVRINTTRREFQFEVTNCSKAVVADIPQLSDEINTYIVECKSREVLFLNKSIGGFSYLWDFGVPGATSTEFQPIFVYPDTGTYTVKLTVNANSTCPDSISRFVKVYPSFKADFSFDGLLCPKADIDFMDLSDATFKPITDWNWSFGDGNFSTLPNPKHAYQVGGTYPVQLISKTIRGCMDTITQNVTIDEFVPFAGNDTIIVKGESINFVASGGDQYLWTPGDNLNFVNIRNPRGAYPDTGRYNYTVFIKSNEGCEDTDDINVWVVNQASLFVPSGFTPNGDGLNDLLRPINVGYSKLNYFRVFNRWGELVYSTDKINAGWDGYYKGEKAEIGTYFWLLSIQDRFGKDQTVKGDATLIR
ncbi:MAG: PKD domain-containing protein [Flavipsychrobacter sp.]